MCVWGDRGQGAGLVAHASCPRNIRLHPPVLEFIKDLHFLPSSGNYKFHGQILARASFSSPVPASGYNAAASPYLPPFPLIVFLVSLVRDTRSYSRAHPNDLILALSAETLFPNKVTLTTHWFLGIRTLACLSGGTQFIP